MLPTTLPGGGEILGLDVGGASIGKVDRAAILARLRDGEEVRMEMAIRAFVQTDAPNRNFVRFRESKLGSFAKTFVGMPFLRDHNQRDLTARGGTVLQSSLEDNDGEKAINQRVLLTAPWAVEMAARGLMDKFSIGWSPTGPVLCTVCEQSIFAPTCSHYPGQTYDGKLCEILYTDAVGVETSGVSVPGVADTGIEEIRAVLSAARIEQRVPAREAKTMTQISLLAAKLSSILGLPPETSEEELASRVDTLTKKAREFDDLQVLYAGEQAAHAQTKTAHAQLAKDLDQEREDKFESGMASLLESAMRQGKLQPTQVIGEDGKASFVDCPVAKAARTIGLQHGLEEAKKYLDGQTPRVRVGGLQSAYGSKAPRKPTLDEYERKAIKQMGITEEQYRKHNPIGE